MGTESEVEKNDVNGNGMSGDGVYLFPDGVPGDWRLVCECVDGHAEGSLVLLLDLVFAHAGGVVCGRRWCGRVSEVR